MPNAPSFKPNIICRNQAITRFDVSRGGQESGSKSKASERGVWPTEAAEIPTSREGREKWGTRHASNVKINFNGSGRGCPLYMMTGWYHPRDGAAREIYYV
jgi:hypothetical protein